MGRLGLGPGPGPGLEDGLGLGHFHQDSKLIFFVDTFW